jgi:hypothetical protein
MPGDAVTHKMQLFGWEKTEKYFLSWGRYVFLLKVKLKLLWPVSSILGFWHPDYLIVCPHISLLINKNFSDASTG